MAHLLGRAMAVGESLRRPLFRPPTTVYSWQMRQLIALTLLTTLAFTSVAAEVYRVVKPDGSIEFSDEPATGGEPVTIKPLPSYSPPNRPPAGSYRPANGEKTKVNKPVHYTHFVFTAPFNEGTVFHDAKGVTVLLSVVPPLAAGHQIELTLNGKVVGRTASNSFVIPEVYRGSHSLAATILDETGRTVKSTPPIRFYLRQRSAR